MSDTDWIAATDTCMHCLPLWIARAVMCSRNRSSLPRLGWKSYGASDMPKNEPILFMFAHHAVAEHGAFRTGRSGRGGGKFLQGADK